MGEFWKKMKDFKGHISRWVRTMAAPVKAEPVFFVLTFLMCIEQPIHWMCYILDNRVEQTLQFVQGLSIEFAVVYLATCLIYWVKGKRAKIAVKALLYMLFWTLMGITLFLALNFEMCISQQTLTVLVETNPKESSEFVDTYMLTNASQLSYLLDFVVLVATGVCERKLLAITVFFRRKLNKRLFTWFTSLNAAVGRVPMAVY